MKKPRYYTVLTPEVRYNKKISANEKILYSEIFTLSQKSGGCFASNEFFAKLYGVHKVTISKWISTLKSEKLIKISYHIQDGNVEKRVITPLSENVNPPKSKRLPPLSENAKYNNTSINKSNSSFSSDEDEIIFGGFI